MATAAAAPLHTDPVFHTAAHLVSWTKFARIDRQSAGTKRGGSTGKGNPWLAATLGEVVARLARTHTFIDGHNG